MTGQFRARSAVCGVLVAALFLGNTAIARAQTTSTVPCYSYDENCKSIIKKTAIIGGVLIGVVIMWKIISGHQKKAQSDAPPDTLRLYYDPTSGVANEHVVMQLKSNCPGSSRIGSVQLDSGKLPPGLKIEDNTISGTPLTSGTWVAGITIIGSSCAGRNGKVKSYDMRTISVTIRIE